MEKVIETGQEITVKNAEGDPDTKATIVHQNSIDYEPKVSVIIPVYNTEKYLRECLDSVTNQTLKEIEIICINDGSTDNSLEILKDYAQKDNRITAVTQQNSGSGIARNCGLNLAKGEFVAFMDPDDYYPKNTTLETLYSKAKENNVNIAGGSMQKFSKEKGIFPVEQMEPEYVFHKEGIVFFKDYQFDYGYSRFIYNRELLFNNKIMFPNYLRRQDPPFFIEIMYKAKKFYAIAEETYTYRVSYKEIEWTQRRITDLILSMTNSLKYTSEKKLYRLHYVIANRLCSPFYINAFKYLYHYDKENNLIEKMVNELNYNAICKYNSKFVLPIFYRFKPQHSKVSIIISVYNAEKYISTCIESVINQTYKDLEIICIDDGSKDNSLAILKEFAKNDARIIILSHENIGLASSRNEALKIAKGEYVQFVDADDYLRIDAIELLVKRARSSNADLISFGGINFTDYSCEQQINPYYEFQYLPESFNTDSFSFCDCKKFIHEMAVSSCLTMYKHEFLKDKNILFPSGLCFEDNLFFCKAITQAKICSILKERLYFRRIHPASITQNWEKHNEDFIKISELILEYLKKSSINADVYENYKLLHLETLIHRFNSCSTKYQKKYYKKTKAFIKKYNSRLLYKLNNHYGILQNIFSLRNDTRNTHKIITILGLKLKVKRKQEGEYSMLENIFSIKNKESRNNKWYKVVTILGIKFKFKNKDLTQRKHIEEQNKNIAEFNNQLKKDFEIVKKQGKELKQEIHCTKNRIENLKKDINALKYRYDSVLKKLTPQANLRSFVYHLAEHCNLYCYGCDHFSPLAKEKLANIDDYKNDVKRLSELTKQELEIIKLMGGEPLLHPQINDFIRVSRKYFPRTRIEIVTNGILLNTQNENFWKCCKENDITIVPTKYPLNIDYDKAKETATSYGVKYEYYGHTEEVLKTSAHIPLDPDGKQNAQENFINCFHANNCVMLKDGRIYTCTVAPNIEHFNNYFGYSIPLTERDGIDIHKAESIEEILEFLARPIPFCKYCNVNGRTYNHKWCTSKRDLKEWVKM